MGLSSANMGAGTMLNAPQQSSSAMRGQSSQVAGGHGGAGPDYVIKNFHHHLDFLKRDQ